MNRSIVLGLIVFITSPYAEEPSNLDELLEQVKKERTLQKEELLQRESKFKDAHSKQKKLFELYPEILLIDCTYQIDYFNHGIFIIAILDNNR